MSRLDNILENTALARFLGMEEVADLRRMVKECIVDVIRQDLEGSSLYFIEPDEINDILGNVVEEAVNEIKEEYKELIKEQLEDKIKVLLDGREV